MAVGFGVSARARKEPISPSACPAIGCASMPGEHVVHVVEDDLAMRDALLLLLESAGLPARGYGSAEDFLEKEQRYDRGACLLVDVRLPGMDGLALLRYLFSRGAEPAIVMITGHGDIALAVAALKAGAMDFVTKPFNPAELLDSVREAWRCSACKAARGRGGGKRGSLSDADASRDINSYASRRRAIKQAYRGRVGNKRSHCRAPPCQHHGKASSAHSL